MVFIFVWVCSRKQEEKEEKMEVQEERENRAAARQQIGAPRFKKARKQG